MWPIVAEFDGFSLRGFGVLGALAFLVTTAIGAWRAQRLGIPPARSVDLSAFVALCALVGARGLWVWQHPAVWGDVVAMVNLRNGGLVFYGAMILGFPAGIGWMWATRMPILAVLDVWATALPWGHAVSRIGCFLAGCCYGVPWAGWGGLTFSHPASSAPQGVALFPSQLAEAGWLVLVALATWRVWQVGLRPGRALATYLGLYAVGRLLLEGFRGDPERGSFMPTVLGEWLSFSQGLSLCVVGAVLLWWVMGRSTATNLRDGSG